MKLIALSLQVDWNFITYNVITKWIDRAKVYRESCGVLIDRVGVMGMCIGRMGVSALSYGIPIETHGSQMLPSQFAWETHGISVAFAWSTHSHKWEYMGKKLKILVKSHTRTNIAKLYGFINLFEICFCLVCHKYLWSFSSGPQWK